MHQLHFYRSDSQAGKRSNGLIYLCKIGKGEGEEFTRCSMSKEDALEGEKYLGFGQWLCAKLNDSALLISLHSAQQQKTA